MPKTKINTAALGSKDPKEKYGRLKQLLAQSKSEPQKLYGDLDTWLEMLSNENNFIKWAGIDIIGHLSAVDNENKIDKHVSKLFKILHGGKMISANHAVYALGLIAESKPKLRSKIIQELLQVSKDKFETDECKNIVIGKVILVFNDLAKEITTNKEALVFIKKASNNSRNATRKKGEILLKKLKNMKNISF